MKSLFVFGVLTVVLLLITSMTDIPSKAGANAGGSQVTRLADYDIRSDRSQAGVAKLSARRGEPRPELMSELQTGSRYKIERSAVSGVAEIITTVDGNENLSSLRSGSSRTAALRSFIKANPAIFGVREDAQLVESADYTNPDGNLSFVRFEQRIANVPVFGAEVTGAFSRDNELFRIVNNIAPAIESSRVRTNFGAPELAVAHA